MAMTAQEYLDTFNAAINAGAYDSAANILRAAEGDFGPGIYDVAGVVLEANPNLPQEIDYMSPQGIQSIRDYVASVPAPVTAVSPRLNLVNTLPETGLVPSGNVSGTGAGVVSSGPPVGSLQNPAVQSPIALTPAGIAAPAPPAVDPVAQKYVNDFNTLINQGNYDGAARLVKEADLAGYGDEAYRAAAVALDANTNLPPELNFLNAEGIQSIRDYVNTATAPPPAPAPVDPNVEEFNRLIRTGDPANWQKAGQLATSLGFTPEQIRSYLNDPNVFPEFGGGVTYETVQSFVPKPAPVSAGADVPVGGDAGVSTGGGEAGTPGTPEGEGAPTAPTGRTIAGLPTYTRQEFTPLTFAPVRRGIAQLRPAMYMPGLTSGQAPLGGSGFTPEALRTASEGLSPADRAYLMDVGGVSPAELSGATGTPTGQLQAEYNQSRPGGLFGTGAPAPRGLPEDFALQTGAYGAPNANPIALTPPTSASAPTPESSFEDQMGYLSNMYLGRPLSPSELSTYRTDFGGTLNRSNINDFLNRSQEEMGNRLLVGTNPEGATNNSLDLMTPSVMDAVSKLASKAGGTREGGVIKMAEGGEAMPKLSASEAGSKFDIADYIDDQGRLVGGYSKPIYDENRVITGYEYRPYERDVVFGEELRGKEAAMRLTDAEREQMMVEMAMRQGRTGIDPRMGGLAGIEIGDPMMRRRPQYYSTVEQFRPRYAEGGLASIAQDLADKGRFGDTMVAHISPQEAGLLKAMGGAGTINPETGLPEFFSLFPKKGIKLNLGPLGNVKIGAKSSNLIQAAAALAIGDYVGLTAGQAALAYGGVRTAATGNLMEGIQAGLTAYGMGSTYNQFADVPIGGASGAPAGTGSLSGGTAGVDAGTVGSQNVYSQPIGASMTPAELALREATYGPGGGGFPSNSLSFDPATGEQLVTGMEGVAPAGTGTMRTVAQPTYGTSGIPGLDKTVGATSASEGFLGRNLPPAVQEYTPKFLLDASGTQLAIGSTLGSSLIAGQQERSGLAAAQAEEERKRRELNERYRQLAASTLGRVRTAKAGGLMKLAGGGMTYMEAGGTTGPTGVPRDVTGTGDGMSDSVPATIEGVQEARLADGEFVIPADVVADIGNGSSDAGSKKLYDMMDRVRKARHGTTEQPPEIRAERLMPA